MEPVVYDDTPLATYLKDEGDGSEPDWAHLVQTSSRESSAPSDTSPPMSPSMGFAPTGRPQLKSRFRSHIPKALQVDVSRASSLRSMHRHCSAAVTATIDRADNAKFLEQFRYTIVASQLLSAWAVPGQHQPATGAANPVEAAQTSTQISTEGVTFSVLGAFAIAIISSSIWHASARKLTWQNATLILVVVASGLVLGRVHMTRRWLRYQREQSLSELGSFISQSHEYDRVLGAALSLVQEVELVSRGYRLSAPLPPISRLEDRSQNRRCVRLRKAIKTSFTNVLQTYSQVSNAVKAFSEQTDLEKYYDIYDISDFDISDALQGAEGIQLDEAELLRTLKILAARFHTTRKMFLCALLALDASEDNSDLPRWTAVVEALRGLRASTESAYMGVRAVLDEEESFPTPSTPKVASTPGRERWRAQLRKINSLSTGIRGLQAKLQLLREESDMALNDSNDISELGPDLMVQYESIGSDLKDLMSAWEEGKAALALGIDRNEKRLSSMSTLFSPTSSMSGLTTVEEGGADEALKALTGEIPRASDLNDQSDPETLEVFEAVALPRPRSVLTREERIVKMREEREQKALARQQMDATRGMLRELETVINLRPRNRTSLPLGGRIVSM